MSASAACHTGSVIAFVDDKRVLCARMHVRMKPDGCSSSVPHPAGAVCRPWHMLSQAIDLRPETEPHA